MNLLLGDYGKSILMPELMPDLDTWTRTPTITNKWISSWIIGRGKINIITVSIATSNVIFLCFSLQ